MKYEIGKKLFYLEKTWKYNRNKITMRDSNNFLWYRYENPMMEMKIRKVIVIGRVFVTEEGVPLEIEDKIYDLYNLEYDDTHVREVEFAKCVEKTNGPLYFETHEDATKEMERLIMIEKEKGVDSYYTEEKE